MLRNITKESRGKIKPNEMVISVLFVSQLAEYISHINLVDKH